MTKFWVRTLRKGLFPHDATTTAVYAKYLGEALDYAYDYLCSPYFSYTVQVFDDDMNELICVEF